MKDLAELTASNLARAIERLRSPVPGGKVEAAREFGVDLSLLMEQVKLSPGERARRMHVVAQTSERARGAARKRSV